MTINLLVIVLYSFRVIYVYLTKLFILIRQKLLRKVPLYRMHLMKVIKSLNNSQIKLSKYIIKSMLRNVSRRLKR